MKEARCIFASIEVDVRRGTRQKPLHTLNVDTIHCLESRVNGSLGIPTGNDGFQEHSACDNGVCGAV